MQQLQGNVNVQRSSAFWPEPEKPHVFCHIAGEEETDVEDNSKSNSKEAAKIVRKCYCNRYNVVGSAYEYVCFMVPLPYNPAACAYHVVYVACDTVVMY